MPRLALAGWVLCWAGAVWACNIPVFRYALERWESYAYEIVVFHWGELAQADRAVVQQIEKRAAVEQAPANCEVRTVDLADEPDAAMQRLFWQAHGRIGSTWAGLRYPELPWVVLRYPEHFRADPAQAVWAGRLSMSAAKGLVDSPVRSKIAKRIAAGDSVVWVLLESGDRAKDEAAAALLEKELKKSRDRIAEAESDVEDAPEDEEEGMYGPPPSVKVTIAFSLLRVSRTDPAEKVLVNMLVRGEPELAQEKYASQPMAFPVFGRGRALWGLVGKGINADNIAESCEFLVGPCSCMVKDQNPGTDLLIAADWEAAAGDSLISNPELPPLIGLPAPAAESGSAQAQLARADAGWRPLPGEQAIEGYGSPPDARGGSGSRREAASDLLRNVLVALVSVFAAVILLTALVFRRTRSRPIRG